MAPLYEIAEVEDISTQNAVRRVFRIKLASNVSTEARLRFIAEGVVAEQLATAVPPDALTLFFYLPDSDIHAQFTAGRAVWAPGGKWENARRHTSGDYSENVLVIEAAGAFGPTPTAYPNTLSETVRRQVYYDLVKEQDATVGQPNYASRAYETIAKRYGITVEGVRQVSVEGTLKGWPIPPLR